MAKTVRVKAREGIKVPREGRPRSFITAEKPVTVRLSAYYRRAIKDGDLVEVGQAAPKKRTARKEA